MEVHTLDGRDGSVALCVGGLGRREGLGFSPRRRDEMHRLRSEVCGLRSAVGLVEQATSPRESDRRQLSDARPRPVQAVPLAARSSRPSLAAVVMLEWCGFYCEIPLEVSEHCGGERRVQAGVVVVGDGGTEGQP